MIKSFIHNLKVFLLKEAGRFYMGKYCRAVGALSSNFDPDYAESLCSFIKIYRQKGKDFAFRARELRNEGL